MVLLDLLPSLVLSNRSDIFQHAGTCVFLVAQSGTRCVHHKSAQGNKIFSVPSWWICDRTAPIPNSLALVSTEKVLTSQEELELGLR